MSANEFRLLGPLEVWRAGQQLKVSGTKPRALLAVLLLHAEQVVSTDELIEALWGERPPDSAANALQVYVSALRRALEPKQDSSGTNRMLVTRAPGYLLQLGDHELDVLRFEHLVADARPTMMVDPAGAVRVFRSALELWRGPALADFLYERFAGADAARLEEVRLGAREDCLECELACGNHAAIVAELESLVAEHPLRERLTAQLMLALYRCGRQAEASRAYHAARTSLAEELGMEPGVALRELHQRILEQDRELEPPGTSTAAPARGASPGQPRHNLSIELTSFVGREHELDAIVSLLQETRLLTLTGAGGSGKTRLALRAARRMLDAYRDGVWLIELAPLSDPALVPSAAVAALGIRAQAGSLLDALKRSLRDAELLIVLDNCEHLLDACAELAHELLASCALVRILATSRQPLSAAGETAWPVPGLELPDEHPSLTTEELGRSAAVRLFADRARAVHSGFSLDADVVGTVAAVCRRLDGIPLAIELAAARAQVLSPDEILLRLDDRFRLLSRGTRDVLPRHQTLQATVDWSHDLLSEPERVLFRRLSVFAGGWTLSDAERVCAAPAPAAEDVFDLLSELVAKSLLTAEPSGSGATRYGMLETLRIYAARHLNAAGELERVARRHLDHFLGIAERAHEQRERTGLNAELETMLAHQDNIRAALAFARATDPDGMLRLASAVGQLWLAGRISEGRRWLTDALAIAPAPTLQRIRALNRSASLAILQQRHDQGRWLLDESLDLAAKLDDRSGEAEAWLWLGFLGLTADPPKPEALRRSLVLHEQVADRVGICRSLLFLGVALSQYPASAADGEDALRRAAAMAGELDDGWSEAFAHIFLGWAELNDGDHALAASHLGRAVGTEALGPIRGTGIDALATLALATDPARAARLVGASAAVREHGGGVPPPWLERRSQLVRDRAEAVLGAAEAGRAWEEGRRMSTAQAIAYALETARP